MFENLTDKLGTIFKTIRGHGKLTERNIKDAMREVRRALLEADVNFKVARDFIKEVEDECLGVRVMKSLTPGNQVVKIVNEKLITLLGSQATDIRLSPAPPTAIMVVGLQGSGKTTFLGKLATHFNSSGKSPMLIAADIHRPAAIDQLEVIGKKAHSPVYSDRSESKAWKIVRDGSKWARENNNDVILIDTAGRLHIDQEMMNEVKQVKEEIKPNEILFIADAMTGQDAVNVAKEFNDQLEIDGIVLTKMDGDARGGAAISIKAVTGKPIKFVSSGEKLETLEKFYPDRMASRILGMGDVLSLIEKAQSTIDKEEAVKLEQKLWKETFTFEDFLSQLQQIKKMGSIEDLLGMIPGIGTKMKGFDVDPKAMIKIEAIINSMTRKERLSYKIIDGSRRKRIAKGSGTSVQDVNKVLKQFEEMQRMIKMMKQNKLGKLGKKSFFIQ